MTTTILVLFWMVSLPTPAPAAGDSVPLFTNLGSHHVPITTSVPLAQEYFDQGMRLTYAFNHAEAIRAFREAARRDPSCAMCWWGVALAYGPNINMPMDSAAGVQAYEAARQAQSLLRGKSPREQALVRAMTTRYGRNPVANRERLDSAYAAAMRDVVRRFPDDLDAATLLADALMNLRPWDYWHPDGGPKPGVGEIVSTLERVVERNPNHPGACHLYIHAVEAAYPQRAVPCAERLAGLMPGAGHLVHMPAHIYIRVGRYGDAIRANEHAVHADEAYIADQRPDGLYPMAYYPHNYHFLAFAAIMAGRSAVAVEAARAVVRNVPVEVALLVPFLEGVPAYGHLALVTFGRWDEVLREPMPPAELRTATGLAHYARAVAFAATNQPGAAGAARDSARAMAQWSRAERGEGGATAVLELAWHAAEGELAARAGRSEEALAHFRQAVEIEDRLPYDEPPPWYYPVRQSLGKALLEAGRAAEAEAVYREELGRFPENGWSLYGLLVSLRAQGKAAEAAGVDARFRRAWRDADVTLTGSRF